MSPPLLETVASLLRRYMRAWRGSVDSAQSIPDAFEGWATVYFTPLGLKEREPSLREALLRRLREHEAALAAAQAAAAALREELERQEPTAGPGAGGAQA